jgi:hypothetical protein
MQGSDAMIILTRYGAFSVARAPKGSKGRQIDKDHLVVRAANRQRLLNLFERDPAIRWPSNATDRAAPPKD